MNQQQSPESRHLVAVIDGKPVTTTLAIAEGVGRPHHGVIQLVRQHQADFEEFGPLAFEMRMGEALPQGGYGKATEFALLNQHQATMLLTYMRNTDVIRKFKIALIKAFFAMAEELQHYRAQEIPGMALPLIDFPERDRPAIVKTFLGNAYINTATYFFCAAAARDNHSPELHQLVAALTSRTDLKKSLPGAVFANHKLKMALLKSNPLWSDIMYFHSMGVSTATTARLCGCHASTVKRHLKKMEDAGLFDDPLAGLKLEVQA